MKTEKEIRDSLDQAEFELADDERFLRDTASKKYPGYEGDVVETENRMRRTRVRIGTLRWVLEEQK